MAENLMHALQYNSYGGGAAALMHVEVPIPTPNKGLSNWQWDDHPAIMAVGVVDGTSEAIFQTLMSLGPSRSEWYLCVCLNAEASFGLSA
ncbi:hypothetical protein ES319_D03G064300v1 [Gossypium barbadense]|uniref:Uncharacterized protein n=2 Tax=Gossypium TaxID=3633 RepID=A0A5J5S275_GOSBA|nr:hypothetical protein ES319_D03G064300v1 [Gossypium barbadense]TYG75910.1 hypothetical protein ES288_D03G070600v1 [Gossypium darwinii]